MDYLKCCFKGSALHDSSSLIRIRRCQVNLGLCSNRLETSWYILEKL